MDMCELPDVAEKACARGGPDRQRRARAATILLLLAACGGGGSTSETTGNPGYTPGVSYFGRNQYVEYVAGNLPLIFAAPHGGSLTPGEIPDRTPALCGGVATTSRDTNTEELTRAIQAAFGPGKYPHLIINRLHRIKLDANREIVEGACGVAEAETAWREFQDYIGVAKAKVLADSGRGWFTDVHGHAHAIARIEVGYLLTAAELRLSDAVLDASVAYENKSSMRSFSAQAAPSFSAALRGAAGLGTLLAAAGHPATPSQQDPAPAVAEEYFTGGYNTVEHGCSAGGAICGVQLEHHFIGLRDNPTNRAAYAAALVGAYQSFLSQNFGITW
jgi:N-formylglutamate amidohydrolase